MVAIAKALFGRVEALLTLGASDVVQIAIANERGDGAPKTFNRLRLGFEFIKARAALRTGGCDRGGEQQRD